MFTSLWLKLSAIGIIEPEGIPYPKFLVQTKAYADKNSLRVTNFPLNN